ncbi:MAG TPA: glycosyltransferase family A protein, partial [Mucilaginibacter sp.]|nr:glycosyltransferase family A protein [Mucilaginibacter sp.]
MKIKSKVSIVIPVYNGSRYLRQTVDAVLEQSFTEFEILIVNDGSTDDTARIALDLQKKDNRIALF